MSEHYTPLDPGRIDLVDPLEREYWQRELGCSDEELQAAVAAVGTHTAEVREHLEKRSGQ